MTSITPPSREEFCSQINAFFADDKLDLYAQLNAMRDWVNIHYKDFELYLEDTWNERTEGETHLEYILRSRRTLNETDVLGYDAYLNHQDEKNVWHLDDYTHSIQLFETPDEIYDFIEYNSETEPSIYGCS
jgi:hypothetical protein